MSDVLQNTLSSDGVDTAGGIPIDNPTMLRHMSIIFSRATIIDLESLVDSYPERVLPSVFFYYNLFPHLSYFIYLPSIMLTTTRRLKSVSWPWIGYEDRLAQEFTCLLR